jgi:hypothetical protein
MPDSVPAMKKSGNNFDFLVGDWTSTQRRLTEVLNGCTEWYEFAGITRCWSILDGAGNVDEVSFPTQDFSGVTLRLYRADRDEWSLYWASTRSGLAMPATVGRFDDTGVGTFTNEEEYGGRPITVRYQWLDITDRSCRWEQAFSTDGGATWETNWTADFQRTT